jgi:hypothetical protein
LISNIVLIIHLPFQLDIPRAAPYQLKESLSPHVQDLKKKKKKEKKVKYPKIGVTLDKPMIGK